MGAASGLMKRLHGPVYAARQRALVHHIVEHLEAGDRVLDVGCGFGALGRAIADASECPEGVEVRGLERFKRDNELIEVVGYDGGTMPFDDDAFDVVIIADVLHHEEDPDALTRECARVAGRCVILKDHQRAGLLAQSRISLIDWAANAPYGVPCLYRYNSHDEWRASHERCGLHATHELTSMQVYPPVVNLLFGRRLHYLAVLQQR